MNIEKTISRCAFGTMVALMVVLAAATLIEKVYGREFVLEQVYGAKWLVFIWVILGITSFVYILLRRLYRQTAAFLLHCAFGLILFGAFITYLAAERGQIHIRQGEAEQSYLADDGVTERTLPFDVKLVLFDIEYHPGSDEPADFISFLKVDGEMCRVSMNKIFAHKGYRFYQTSYDPDEMGTLLSINRDPWGIGITYAGYLLLAIAMLWLLRQRLGWKGMLYTFVPVAGLWLYISRLNPMTPVLRSPLLAVHVSVIMISYALLIVITLFAIIGLCSHRLRLQLYRWNATLLYPALFLLASGIFIGAVWANVSWGRYWGWDAKETWALITLLVYTLPMHKGSFKLFRNPVGFHCYCAIASLAIAMTFFGVTYFLGGIHSYV